MKRRMSFLEYLKRNPIMVSFCLSTGIVVSCLVFYSRYFNGPISTDIDDWAGFATFCGFSLSLISIIFIFMTYRSQQELSSILQFESSFFQWLEMHNSIYNECKVDIEKYYDQVVSIFISNSNDLVPVEFEKNLDNGKSRHLMRYYRHLYQLYKYIYLSEVLTSIKKKKKYYDIIQAQMGDKELFVVLYLLLGDKRKTEEKALKGILYYELLDEAHLFKNIYYPKESSNFKEFERLMRNVFVETRDSFYYLTDKTCDISQGEENPYLIK